MAHAAGLALIHFRHGHFCLAFFNGKRLRMTLITRKRRVAGVMEINILHRRFIFQHSGVISRFFGGRLIFVTAVAVVKRRSVFGGMTGKARFSVDMIVEINPGSAPPIGKHLRMTGFTARFKLMAFMLERNGFSALAEMDGFLRRGNGLFMTPAAITPGKRIFALLVMAGEAVLIPAVIRHRDFCRSFFGFKQGGMAAAARCFFDMRLMMKRHTFIALAQHHG